MIPNYIPKEISAFDTWFLDLQIQNEDYNSSEFSEFHFHLRELLDLDNLFGRVLGS